MEPSVVSLKGALRRLPAEPWKMSFDGSTGLVPLAERLIDKELERGRGEVDEDDEESSGSDTLGEGGQRTENGEEVAGEGGGTGSGLVNGGAGEGGERQRQRQRQRRRGRRQKTGRRSRLSAVQLLRQAVLSGDGAHVQEVLKEHGEVNNIDEDGMTALHVAAKNGRDSCLMTLLSCGALVDARSPKQHTPLMLACLSGYYGCVRHLMAAGADISAQSHDGRTAMHFAAEVGSEGCIRELLPRSRAAATALVNVQDDDGRTACHFACIDGAAGCVRLLLAAGSQVNLQDCWGRDAVDIAEQMNGVDTLAALASVSAKASQALDKLKKPVGEVESAPGSKQREVVGGFRKLWSKRVRAAEDAAGPPNGHSSTPAAGTSLPERYVIVNATHHLLTDGATEAAILVFDSVNDALVCMQDVERAMRAADRQRRHSHATDTAIIQAKSLSGSSAAATASMTMGTAQRMERGQPAMALGSGSLDGDGGSFLKRLKRQASDRILRMGSRQLQAADRDTIAPSPPLSASPAASCVRRPNESPTRPYSANSTITETAAATARARVALGNTLNMQESELVLRIAVLDPHSWADFTANTRYSLRASVALDEADDPMLCMYRRHQAELDKHPEMKSQWTELQQRIESLHTQLAEEATSTATATPTDTATATATAIATATRSGADAAATQANGETHSLQLETEPTSGAPGPAYEGELEIEKEHESNVCDGGARHIKDHRIVQASRSPSPDIEEDVLPAGYEIMADNEDVIS